MPTLSPDALILAEAKHLGDFSRHQQSCERCRKDPLDLCAVGHEIFLRWSLIKIEQFFSPSLFMKKLLGMTREL